MKFTVQYRENSGKGVNRKLQADGFAPGIVYGKGEETKVFMRKDHGWRFLLSFQGITKPFDLEIVKGEETITKKVIVQEYQVANYGEHLVHVDFREVDDETVVKADVPIVTTGLSPAVKLGGILQVIRRTIPVKAAIKDLPETLTVDVSDLNFGDSVHVMDLPYGENAKPIVHGRNFTVITIAGKNRGIAADAEDETAEEGSEEAAA